MRGGRGGGGVCRGHPQLPRDSQMSQHQPSESVVRVLSQLALAHKVDISSPTIFDPSPECTVHWLFICSYISCLQCTFQSGHGWVRGGYTCQCKEGFYPATALNHFNGSLVEVAYSDSFLPGSTTYSMLYVCLPCPPGCLSCSDSTPCMAQFSWPLRSQSLTVWLFFFPIQQSSIIDTEQYYQIFSYCKYGGWRAETVEHRMETFSSSLPLFLERRQTFII